MVNFLQIIALSFWFIAPAYATNAIPPLLRGRTPIDQGRKLKKHKILGRSKTLRGTIGGIVFGIAFGLVQLWAQAQPAADPIMEYFGIPKTITLGFIVAMAIGAMSGDLLGSFIKRRLNIPPGSSLFLLDQLGFVILGMLFAAPFWIAPIEVIIFLFLITPIIHWTFNIIAHRIKLKKHPW